MSVSSDTFFYIKEVAGKDYESAFALYFRFLVQMRAQNNRVTVSTDSFMERAMGWGHVKYVKVKRILKDSGLIVVTNDNEDGAWRVEVYQTVPSEPNHRYQNDTTGIKTIRIKTIPQKDTNNNTSNNTSNKKESIRETVDSEIATVKEEQENKEPKVSSVIIKTVLTYLVDRGYAYKKEEPFMAYVLQSDINFKRACDEFGDVASLVDALMEFAETNDFWKGKITGVNSFGKSWATLYNQSKASGKLKRIKKLDSGSQEAFSSLIENA